VIGCHKHTPLLLLRPQLLLLLCNTAATLQTAHQPSHHVMHQSTVGMSASTTQGAALPDCAALLLLITGVASALLSGSFALLSG
jgi:hypothetical protein